MRQRIILATLTLVLTLILPLTAAAADPPPPTIRHQFRVASLPVTGPAEVITFLFDFAPGAATPPHTHPGLVLATVLEGAITFRTGGAEKVYQVGESFIERPGEIGTALNMSGARTRVVVSILVPQGAAPSAPQPGGPSPAPATPTALYLQRSEALLPAAPSEIAHAVLDFAPGAQTPAHTHPGQVFVTVLEGAITFRTGGTEKVYQVGESFVEQSGVVVQARNVGNVKASVMATYILPKGAPLSTPVTMPGLPATGGGGSNDRQPTGWLVLVVGCALVVGVRLVWYRVRHA